MSNLNAWQKLDRVIAGRPFGDGAAGNSTISSDPNTRATASGSSGSSSLTIGSSVLSNGDVFVIHQTQGSGHDQWEINKVLSGGGTTSITCFAPLHYSYGSGAQVIKFSMNSNVTVNNHTIAGWDGSKGGIEVICGRISVVGSGTITGTGTGFRGGSNSGSSADGQQGEGYPGT